MARSVLGIIPARGGSKSIPGKNIKSFVGRPLIAWVIGALRESKICDRVIVSTDDEAIAEVAKKYGAEVPFMRPAELAQDDTPTLPVLRHAVLWLKEHEGYEPSVMVLAQATSPGVEPKHFQEGMEMFLETGADSVVSVVPVPAQYNPHWQFFADAEGRMTLATGERTENVIGRRQDLPRSFIRNSAFYIFKPELLFGPDPSFYGDDVRGYVMDEKHSSDIDTPEDWVRAEQAFEELKNHGK